MLIRSLLKSVTKILSQMLTINTSICTPSTSKTLSHNPTYLGLTVVVHMNVQ